MKHKYYGIYLKLSPQELIHYQKKNGFILYYIGVLVYKILILLKFQPKSFYNICPYFEIGENWGGLELGWFFICDKDSSDDLKCHELGHGIQNAAIGGFKMVGLCILSALRYWYRIIFKIKTPYDSWWFEGQATELGTAYLNNYLKEKKDYEINKYTNL